MNDFDSKLENKILNFLKTEIGYENYAHALDRGLTRIRPIFKDLVNQFSAKVIIIGGTNGKGEVSYNVAKKLLSAKRNYGLWSSPHLLSVRERFVNNGSLISYEDLDRIMQDCFCTLNENNQKLSFYEFLFYVFLSWLSDKDIEFLILEVGLGGRLDATNLFDAEIAALVSISRDHQEFLGHSLREILYEKLEISRKHTILIHGIQQKYLQNLIKSYCLDREIFDIGVYDQKLIDDKASFHVLNLKIASLITAELGLKRKDENLDKPILRNWHYSFSHCELFLSGSHNVEGIRQLGRNICEQALSPELIVYSSSKRSNSDILNILRTLLAYSNNNCKILVTSFDHIKSIDFKTLKELVGSMNSDRVGVIETWEDAYKFSQSQNKKKILFTGSYYFISDILHDIHISKRVLPGQFKVTNF